jgi:hypothetical protein
MKAYRVLGGGIRDGGVVGLGVEVVVGGVRECGSLVEVSGWR